MGVWGIDDDVVIVMLGIRWQIPFVKKVVVNCGVGEASQNAKALEGTIRDLALVTGQKSVVTRSRKAIAGFKLREGVPVGVTLTLRGEVTFSFSSHFALVSELVCLLVGLALVLPCSSNPLGSCSPRNEVFCGKPLENSTSPANRASSPWSTEFYYQ